VICAHCRVLDVPQGYDEGARHANRGVHTPTTPTHCEKSLEYGPAWIIVASLIPNYFLLASKWTVVLSDM
jgi:hypothetical protein